MARINDDWSYCGLKTVQLENAKLKITVLPEFGANIWQIYYKPKDCELLWCHPRMKPRQVSSGETYDNVFFGGWHELFPNALAESSGMERLLDHGELWFMPWDYEIHRIQPDSAALFCSTCGPITPVEVRKKIALSRDDSFFDITYSLRSLSPQPVDYMLTLHMALRLAEGDRLAISSDKAFLEDIGFPTRIPTGVQYPWPMYNNSVDMSLQPPSNSGYVEFQYGLEPTAGVCSLQKTEEQISLELSYDPVVFPVIGSFATYGGWRGLHTLVLEPSTAYPMKYEEAKKLGMCRTLQVGETMETTVRCSILD